MTKKEIRAEVNSFVGGLITEASPLNFPDNAMADGMNFVLNRDGSQNRRRGMDLEAGHSFVSTDLLPDNLQINTFRWYSVNGLQGKEFLVSQVKNTLYFFNMSEDSLSSSGYIGNKELTGFPVDTVFSFAALEGKLTVVGGAEEISVIEYDESNNTFKEERLRIKVRDLWGVEVVSDTTTAVTNSIQSLINIIDTRNTALNVLKNVANVSYPGTQVTFGGVTGPAWSVLKILANRADTSSVSVSSISQNAGGYEDNIYYRDSNLNLYHIYNLRNQSWGITKDTRAKWWNTDLINYYKNQLGVYPSNSEQIWSGMYYNASDQSYERFSEQLMRDRIGSEPSSAKGYFIIDILKRGASRKEAYEANCSLYPNLNWPSIDLKQDYTTGGPTCVAEFAGRVFFSGFNGKTVNGDKRSPDLSNFICFSQLVNNLKDINKCYQEGDPTSREGADIVATDGGFLRVAGAERILSMVNTGSNLLIIASNGIWVLSGGSDYGFDATNYKVDKLSSFGAVSQRSIVVEGNIVYFWAADGIYAIFSDQFKDLKCESLTKKTIQSLYNKISNSAKQKSKGLYDPYSKTARWIYKEGTPFSDDSETFELVFDTELQAFYRNKIENLEDNSIEVFDLFDSPPFSLRDRTDVVYSGSDAVTVNEASVVISSEVLLDSFSSTRYLCLKKESNSIYLSISGYNNYNFKDWETEDGVGKDAEAYLVTGQQVVKDSAVNKQIPYLITHLKRTENGVVDGVPDQQSSLFIRSQWDFANSVNSNKWGQFFQAYRYRRPYYVSNDNNDDYDNGFDVVSSKNKIRGMGKSFSFHMKTEPGKDCIILGWNISLIGNTIT